MSRCARPRDQGGVPWSIRRKRSRGRTPGFARGQALETALRLFRERGHAGVTVTVLGAEMGVNPPSLYAAFAAAAENAAPPGAPRGCLVMDGARHCGDAAVTEAVQAAQATTARAFRDRAAVEQPDLADEIAGFAMVVLRGLSAAARDGADPAELARAAETAAGAVAQRLSSRPSSGA